MKVLLAYVVGLFVLAAIPRADILRRRPILLLCVAIVVAASYKSLRAIGG